MTEPWAEQGTLNVDGKTLEISCIGPPPNESPTLVLLHEGLGCVRLWRDFPSALVEATGFGVFVYSRAGYGQSDPAELPRPLDYMTREATEVLPEVLDSMDIKSAVTIGHSDGATIAAIHAGSQTPPSVFGVILLAPHFFTEAMGLAEIAKARDVYNSGGLRERMSKYHRDPDNAFRGWNDSWLHPEFEAWNVSEYLDDISVPVLGIQGRDDPYGTLAQIDAISQRVRRAMVTTLILDGCQHSPHLEQREAVVATIAAFCEQAAAIHSFSSQDAG